MSRRGFISDVSWVIVDGRGVPETYGTKYEALLAIEGAPADSRLWRIDKSRPKDDPRRTTLLATGHRRHA